MAADLTAYAYDGLGNRIAQSLGTTSPTVTKYLLDLQPGLAVVLAETTGANVIRNVHSPRGIHAHKDAGGAWEWMMQDGLGSVRGVVDNGVGVLESRNYDPYGGSFGATGSSQTSYGLTGEPMDDNGLLYLRARYYNPVAGVFTALDPFEGSADRPMSLNGYSWVEGNTPNKVDPSGMVYESPYIWSGCGASNVPGISGSGCQLLVTTLATPNGLSQLMAQNPGMDVNGAIQTLISAWRACPCEFYSGRGVSSTNDPLYSYLHERLSGIRLDLDNLIVQSVSDRNLWQPYLQAVRNVDYSNPVPCSFYQVSPPSPYVTPPPDTIPCIGFDPSRIQTRGEIISAGLYVIVGVGASIVFVRDDTGREMTLLAFNPGIGLGGKGFSSYAFVSEQRIEDFAGISAGFDINLFIVGASSSYNPTAGNLCSGTTGGGGVAIGLGVSLTISLAGVVYDSNW